MMPGSKMKEMGEMEGMEDTYIKSWSDQLKEILKPHLLNGFQKLFRQAQKINPSQACKMFQLCLSRIPELPLTVLDDDYQILLDYHKLDPEMFHNIIVGVCASYAKMNLVSHGASRRLRIRKRDLEIPDNMTFIHRCYIEAARELYECPYLLSPKFDRIKLQENTDKVKTKIDECIQRTLMKIIPFQRLHQKYITEEYDPDSDSRSRDGYEGRRSNGSYDETEIDNEGSDDLEGSNDLTRALELDEESARLDRDADLNLDLKINLPGQSGGAKEEATKKTEEKSKSEQKFDPGPMLLVKSRLSRENLNKLQRELERTTNDTRKSMLLENLMAVKDHVPARMRDDPQSTFDLSLDSNELDRMEAKELESMISSKATESDETVMIGQTGAGFGTAETMDDAILLGAGGETGMESTEIEAAEESGSPKIPRVKRIIIRPDQEFEVFDFDSEGSLAEALGVTGPTVIDMPITDWQAELPAEAPTGLGLIGESGELPAEVLVSNLNDDTIKIDLGQVGITGISDSQNAEVIGGPTGANLNLTNLGMTGLADEIKSLAAINGGGMGAASGSPTMSALQESKIPGLGAVIGIGSPTMSALQEPMMGSLSNNPVEVPIEEQEFSDADLAQLDNELLGSASGEARSPSPVEENPRAVVEKMLMSLSDDEVLAVAEKVIELQKTDTKSETSQKSTKSTKSTKSNKSTKSTKSNKSTKSTKSTKSDKKQVGGTADKTTPKKKEIDKKELMRQKWQLITQMSQKTGIPLPTGLL